MENKILFRFVVLIIIFFKTNSFLDMMIHYENIAFSLQIFHCLKERGDSKGHCFLSFKIIAFFLYLLLKFDYRKMSNFSIWLLITFDSASSFS